MGAVCCRGDDDINLYSKKLIRAINKKVLSRQSLFIQIFDIETEIGKEIEINPRLIQLDGLSQLCVENYLYLCGCPLSKINDLHSNSQMLMLDTTNSPIVVSIEAHSSFPHYYPSLGIMKNDFLVILGGKDSVKCELYSRSVKYWRELPELPEERFGGNVYCDDNTNTIFLFGGHNTQAKIVCSNLLKYTLKQGVKWDTVVIMDNSSILARCHSAIIKTERNSILILGGKTNAEDSSDDIVECDIGKKSPSPSLLNYKIALKAKFSKLNVVGENNNALYILDDDDFLVHKISRLGKECETIWPLKMTEENSGILD